MDVSFGKFHPAVCFAFFISAIFFGMFFNHPAFLAVAIAASLTTFCMLKKDGKRRFFLMVLVMMVCICAINPFFNTRGEHVLFTYFGGRPYTMEALIYGGFYGFLFASVLVWFACYNIVMTEEKFTYLFGRVIPSVSLLLSMVLRLVPIFKRRIKAVWSAQCCNTASEVTSAKRKLMMGMNVLVAVASEALENSVHTSDSMKSRGYGSGGRTSFLSYKRRGRDIIAGCFMAVCVIIIVVGIACGEARAEFFPTFEVEPPDASAWAGIAAYAALLFMPAAVQIREEISWHISRSKI